jgi:hypothetical protein
MPRTRDRATRCLVAIAASALLAGASLATVAHGSGTSASAAAQRSHRVKCAAGARRSHAAGARRRHHGSCVRRRRHTAAQAGSTAPVAQTLAAPTASVLASAPGEAPAPAQSAPASAQGPASESGSSSAGTSSPPGEAPEEPASGAGSTGEGATGAEAEPALSSTTPPFRFFSDSSFWNAPLSASAPLDPNSATLVKAFDQEVAKELANSEATINTTSWSVPVYTVPSSQPNVDVLLNKGVGSSTNPLQRAWEAVPLPPGAEPAKGHDKHLVVWQPSTDKMWEFWGFEKTTSGPLAVWGGAMQEVLGNPGVYNPQAWPRLISNISAWEADIDSWGATATSLPVAGGLITLEDFERGQINHALAMAIPKARASVWTTPAQRTDGTSSEATSLPEGAHLRLDPNLQLSTLKLPHTVLMLAEAAQRYGIFVRDKSANVAFYGQDPTPTGTNPYTGPEGYFEGKCACKLLNTFPWSHLQLLKMELHSKG